MWATWTRPPVGTVKLNKDGSKRDNEAACGGLLRDSNDDLIFAFVIRHDHQDVLQAELDALLQCLRMCEVLHISQV